MDIILEPRQLPTADLRGALELWITGPDGQRCLWRGRPVASHDMLSEGTHEQNVRKLWLRLPAAADIAWAEAQLRERVQCDELAGEFWPASA